MDTFKEILRKHVLSIICGVVALIAIVALFWPIFGMYDDEQKIISSRKKAYDDLVRVVNNKRSWPITVQGLGDNAAAPLKLFPNSDRVKAGREIKDRAHEQALHVEEMTATPNVHEQLLRDVLPKPSERRFEFKDAYQKMVTVTLPAELNGTLPPTDAEVHAAADKLWNTQYKDGLIIIAGKPVNYEQTVASWHDAVDEKLERSMRIERASKATCYLANDALTVSKAMTTSPNGPKENEIWYAQNMLWVQQDVIDALQRINKDAHNIPEAPVKHVLKIDIPEDSSQAIGGEGFARTPTGRGSNAGYDVMQFNLVLNVDARKIPAILTELQRYKMITITHYHVMALDGAALAEDGYLYGDVPVVRLQMHGEEIFLRTWTVPLMPATIKTAMSIP